MNESLAKCRQTGTHILKPSGAPSNWQTQTQTQTYTHFHTNTLFLLAEAQRPVSCPDLSSAPTNSFRRFQSIVIYDCNVLLNINFSLSLFFSLSCLSALLEEANTVWERGNATDPVTLTWVYTVTSPFFSASLSCSVCSEFGAKYTSDLETKRLFWWMPRSGL